MDKKFKSRPRNAYKKQCLQIKKIIKNHYPVEDVFGIEKYVMLFLASIQLITPVMFIRFLSGKKSVKARKISVEFYAILKSFLLLFILLYGFSSLSISKWLSIFFIFDVIFYLLGIVFLSKLYTPPISFSRSVLLLIFNLIEIISAYAILFINTESIAINGCLMKDGLTGFYFSIVTFTTLGFGEYLPVSENGELLVIFELLTSFIFVTTILTFFVSQLKIGKASTN
jgi:hypothetical protein